MLRDRIKKYFLDEEKNCAEATLCAANDEYGLGLGAESMEIMRGFGGGMGCESVCGALSGSIAVLGRVCAELEKDELYDVCEAYVHEFEARLGCAMCAELKPRYKKEDVRCYELLLMNADLLDETVKRLKAAE